MSVSTFILAIVDNNIDKVKSLISKYKKQQNTKAFPHKLNVVTTYTFRCHIIEQTDYPLHIAARFGHIDIIKLLVKQGAQINQHNMLGETPLIAAFSYLNSITIDITNTIKTLLDLGCSLEGDRFNSTPLHWATRHSLKPVIKLLIQKDKTTIYSMNDDGNTPVEYAIRSPKSIMNIYYHTDPDILIANKSLLHRAVWNGKDEMIKYLFWLGLPISYLDHKIKCDHMLGNAHTPLEVALVFDNYYRVGNTIALLLALGADADPNVRHKYGSHTEDEVAAIRYDCFFSRSLVSRLLPFCTKSE
jgi:ankyrin repeat protein